MIRQAGKEDLPVLTSLALKLWPGHEKQALETELGEIVMAIYNHDIVQEG